MENIQFWKYRKYPIFSNSKISDIYRIYITDIYRRHISPIYIADIYRANPVYRPDTFPAPKSNERWVCNLQHMTLVLRKLIHNGSNVQLLWAYLKWIATKKKLQKIGIFLQVYAKNMEITVKGKGIDRVLDIALLTWVRLMTRSTLQSRKWQLIGTS